MNLQGKWQYRDWCSGKDRTIFIVKQNECYIVIKEGQKIATIEQYQDRVFLWKLLSYDTIYFVYIEDANTFRLPGSEDYFNSKYSSVAPSFANNHNFRHGFVYKRCQGTSGYEAPCVLI